MGAGLHTSQSLESCGNFSLGFVQAMASPHTSHFQSAQFIVTLFHCFFLSGIRPSSAICHVDKGLIHSCCFGKGRSGTHACEPAPTGHEEDTVTPVQCVRVWKGSGEVDKTVHPSTTASYCWQSRACVCVCLQEMQELFDASVIEVTG